MASRNHVKESTTLQANPLRKPYSPRMHKCPTILFKCPDSAVPRSVDRDIMLCGAPFLRDILKRYPPATPVSVPVSSVALDFIVETIKTKLSAGPLTAILIKLRREHNPWQPRSHPLEELFPAVPVYIKYSDVPEVFEAAEFFLLEKLRDDLLAFFLRNMEQCFLGDNLLPNESPRLGTFLLKAYTAADARERSLLKMNIDMWAENHDFENSPWMRDLNDKMESILLRSGSTSEEASTMMTKKKKNGALSVFLANDKQCYSFDESTLRNASAHFRLREIFANYNWMDACYSPMFSHGNAFYITSGRDLFAFNAKLGTLLNSYKNAFRSVDCTKTLTFWKGRLYCSDDSTICEVTSTGLRRLFESKLNTILRFAVINDTGTEFDFCYATDSEGNFLYRTICSEQGAVIDERRVQGALWPIGTSDEGYTFLWDCVGFSLIVKKAGTTVLQYRMTEMAHDFAFSGPEVYLKFPDHVLVVNTITAMTRVISPIPACCRLFMSTISVG